MRLSRTQREPRFRNTTVPYELLLIRTIGGSSVLRCRSQAAGDPTADDGTDLRLQSRTEPFCGSGRCRYCSSTLKGSAHTRQLIRTGSSEPCSSLSVDYRKTTVKTTVGTLVLIISRQHHLPNFNASTLVSCVGPIWAYLQSHPACGSAP